MSFSNPFSLSCPATQSISLFSAGTLDPLSYLQVPMKAPTASPPQPLSTPRLDRPQELLTKAACGNEGCVEGGERELEEEGGVVFRTDGRGSFPTFSSPGLLHGDGPAGLGAGAESPGEEPLMECPVSWNGSLLQPPH